MQDMMMKLTLNTPLRSVRLLAVHGITPEGELVGDDLLNTTATRDFMQFSLDIAARDDVEAYVLTLTDSIGGILDELVFVPEDETPQFYEGDHDYPALDVYLQNARILHHGSDAARDYVEVSTR